MFLRYRDAPVRYERAGRLASGGCERTLEVGPEHARGLSTPTESRRSPPGSARPPSGVATRASCGCRPGSSRSRSSSSPSPRAGPQPRRRRRTDQERRNRGSASSSRRGGRRAVRRARAPSPPCGRSASSVFNPRSSSHAVSADATRPASRRVRWRRSKRPSSSTTGDSGEEVVVATEHLRGAVQRDVAALLERSQPQWRRQRRVADHRCADAPRPPRGRASSASGSTGASIRIRSASAGGAPVWSYSTAFIPHGCRWSNSSSVPVVGTRGDRDRPTGRQHRQHDPVTAPIPAG